jgi:hypothetical protein
MTRSFRPSTPADVPAVVGLFEEAGLRPNVEPQDLQWKYWQPRADWPGPRSFVLTNGSEPMAHGAVIPGWCAWGAQRIKVIHVIDWAARSGAHGAGTTLLKHIGQQVQALLAVGGSTRSLQILPHIGFRVVGAVSGFVRPLHPWRLRERGESARWRLLPRLARSFAWTLGAPAAPRTDWQVRRLAVEEIPQIAPVFPIPTRQMAVFERSVELLRYAVSCPIVPMALFAVERAGRVRGYFLLASAPGQVRIADCWMDSADPADWRAALLCAVEQAKQDPQAAELVTWASHPLLAESLHTCGFHVRFRVPIQMRAAGEGSMPAGPLHVQMLDSDAAFFHEGRSEFWA